MGALRARLRARGDCEGDDSGQGTKGEGTVKDKVRGCWRRVVGVSDYIFCDYLLFVPSS